MNKEITKEERLERLEKTIKDLKEFITLEKNNPKVSLKHSQRQIEVFEKAIEDINNGILKEKYTKTSMCPFFRTQEVFVEDKIEYIWFSPVSEKIFLQSNIKEIKEIEDFVDYKQKINLITEILGNPISVDNKKINTYIKEAIAIPFTGFADLDYHTFMELSYKLNKNCNLVFSLRRSENTITPDDFYIAVEREYYSGGYKEGSCEGQVPSWGKDNTIAFLKDIVKKYPHLECGSMKLDTKYYENI